MTIMASAPVPPSSRLSDVDTTDLASIPRPRSASAEAIRTGCPPWCSKDHRGHITECEGFSIGLVHERIVTEMTAVDPSTVTDPATATVYVESTTEVGENGPEVITAPRVVLTVAEGPSGDFAGGEGVQGWTGSPAEARRLAAALLAAAELVDGGNH
ncbi:hypothetical protein [Micromonospora sp. NPDC048169]|uniref:DUF6907 domain-containing protein n=1 Tax=Micromonospora sp. NPDC048169 TaxID=3154711 RepID=UPI0033D305BD